MCQSLYIIYVIVIFFIIFIMLLLYIINILHQNDVSSYDYMDFFLCSMRYINNFSETNVNWYMKRFEYTHKLFNIELENENWQTDTDLFIQTCLTAINILSYFIDSESIYYRNEDIWRMSIFLNNMLFNKMKSLDSKFFNNDNIYHIYMSFLISLYMIGSKTLLDNHKSDVVILNDNIKEFLRFYKIRFYSEFSLKLDSNVFDNYRKNIIVCKKFIKQLDINT